MMSIFNLNVALLGKSNRFISNKNLSIMNPYIVNLQCAFVSNDKNDKF